MAVGWPPSPGDGRADGAAQVTCFSSRELKHVTWAAAVHSDPLSTQPSYRASLASRWRPTTL
eukprot:COSAG05_NODE_12117_length_482_cov_352.446475_1_plen_61_part_10